MSMQIAPSILAADFARLADEAAAVASSADLLHVDVMDGHFVPNLTIGPPVIESIRKRTRLPLDVHLMIVEPERYGGRRFLYLANYVEPGHELLALDADELLARYEPSLRRINPAFDRSWIRDRWLFREPAAQPIVTVGYERLIPPLQTGVPGLLLANTTQIYPEDRGTNYAVRLGDQAAAELLQ
jgi:hypothetical protein